MKTKELSEYTDELMNDILFRLKENGGKMLKNAMDDTIEDIYGRMFMNKLGKDIHHFWGAYLSWVDDTYDEMIRRGWIYQKGNTLHLVDKGNAVEVSGARKQRKSDGMQAKLSIEMPGRDYRKNLRKEIISWVGIAFAVILIVAGVLVATGVQPTNKIITISKIINRFSFFSSLRICTINSSFIMLFF